MASSQADQSTSTTKSKKGKDRASEPQLQQNGSPAVKSDSAQELTGAQKKALAKAEKAVRRAKDKGDVAPEAPNTDSEAAAGPSNTAVAQASGIQVNVQNPAVPKAEALPQPLDARTTRRRPSIAARPAQLPSRPKPIVAPAKDAVKDSKQVSFVAHLYGQPRRQVLLGASKDVHPAIQALGLQCSSYIICGSHARCVATLLALKSVVSSYTTPPGNSLARHLPSHHLSHQLSHLKSCRPFSTSQSNAIRWLKNYIANIDPSVPEPTAKSSICAAIDNFLHERFTIAGRVIAAATAASHIQAGDVIITFAKSAVVHAALLAARDEGTSFRVVVVDARPLHEGRALARALAEDGLDVSYCLVTALSHAVRGATRCILGAHAVLGNGAVYSRIGTALVALAARAANVPVVVCAESVKFTEKSALDGIIGNELAPEEELTGYASAIVGSESNSPALGQWRDLEGLQVLNMLYDVTPAEYIDEIVTELGAIPPGAAPAVQRITAVGGMLE